MRRGVVIAFVLVGGATVVLAVSLAKTGMELDQMRLERTDFQNKLDALHRQVFQLSDQRQTLEGQVDTHVRAIEQLKHEIERVRAQNQGRPESSAHMETSVQSVNAPSTASAN